MCFTRSNHNNVNKWPPSRGCDRRIINKFIILILQKCLRKERKREKERRGKRLFHNTNAFPILKQLFDCECDIMVPKKKKKKKNA